MAGIDLQSFIVNKHRCHLQRWKKNKEAFVVAIPSRSYGTWDYWRRIAGPTALSITLSSSITWHKTAAVLLCCHTDHYSSFMRGVGRRAGFFCVFSWDEEAQFCVYSLFGTFVWLGHRHRLQEALSVLPLCTTVTKKCLGIPPEYPRNRLEFKSFW